MFPFRNGSIRDILGAVLRLDLTRAASSCENFRTVIRLALLICFSLPLWAAGGFPETSSKLMVKLTKESHNGVIRFFIENFEPANITATFDLGLVNLKGSTRFPCTLSCAPHQKIEAFTLSPIEAGSQWTYTLTNYYTIGNRLAVHDDSQVYFLPYSQGKSYLVSQAFGGTFSHSGPEKYAIDWNMPEGTPVRAARAGVVVGLRQDSHSGGADRRFENDANYILIEHADQTIANYAHLMPNGVRVKIGDRVEAGDFIGFSGNTGFSSGPHLHLSVFKASDGKTRESIPIRFDTGSGVPTKLVAGQTCTQKSAPLFASRTGLRRAQN